MDPEPIRASACSFAAAPPAAISTAPPGGIGSPPPAATAVTAPARSVFGAAGGKAPSTASAAPATTGVRGPYAEVKSTVCPGDGGALSPVSVRR